MAILASASTVIDTGLTSEIVTLVGSVLGLFTNFPLNVILVFGLCGCAFKLFRQGKKAAK